MPSWHAQGPFPFTLLENKWTEQVQRMPYVDDICWSIVHEAEDTFGGRSNADLKPQKVPVSGMQKDGIRCLFGMYDTC